MQRRRWYEWALRLSVTGAIFLPFTAAAGPPGPNFTWAAGEEAPRGASPEQAARAHLERLRHVHGVPGEALRGLRLLFVHDTGRGGIIVALRPTVAGVDLVHADVKLLLGRDHRLLAVSGRPHPAAVSASARPLRSGAPAAVAAALRGLHGIDVPEDRFIPAPARAGEVALALAAPAAGPRLRRPARVRSVYFPDGGSLVPAHRVVVQTDAGGRDGAFMAIVGDDGRVLERRDLVQRDAYAYRVWAEEGGDHRPLDGPLEDYTPHPIGEPKGGPTGSVVPALISMEGFNTNPDGVADPWLPPGATVTRGNNVIAFANHTDPEGPEDVLLATVTAPGVFDRTYDLTLEPVANTEQMMAAITQAFYTTNWLHDWWYDSGFNEAAGNAQTDNFGRGGEDGDPLRVIAQDGADKGFRDNAYMETLPDGDSPMMHMFLWSSLSSQVTLTVQPPEKTIPAGQAIFGPKIYDIEAELAVIDDAMGTVTTDGCEPAVNDLTGKIAVIDRGKCSFELKAQHAHEAGALGVLFADNLPNMDEYPPGPADLSIPDPPIPALGISRAEGDALKAALMNGPVTAHMVGDTPPEREGSVDAMLIAHEWGHYIHNRLVDCFSWACSGQGEGWGDFLALHLILREGDDLDGTFCDSNYIGNDPFFYFGIRRVPYSADFAKNALTFRHVTDGEPLPQEHPLNDNGFSNSESHNAGEVWATMMWEVYVALHKANQGKKSFDEVRRAMSDYVVAGMMLAPWGPTLVEQRDALLAAIAAQDTDDFIVASEAFARRGAGTCAVGPPRESTTFDGVMEDFEVRPIGALTEVTIDDSVMTCDQDGALDNEEAGQVAVVVHNQGAVALDGAVLTVASASPSLVFPEGDSVAVGPLAPQEKTTVNVPVALAGPLDGAEPTELTITLTTPDGCTSSTQRITPAVLNADRMPDAASMDDVESAETLWTLGPDSEAVWSRQPSTTSGTVWHGLDLPTASDAWLASPPLQVSHFEPFSISFDHVHSFDFAANDGDPLYWDGGVVEITSNEGQSWIDLSVFGDIGYGGTLAQSDNPLGERPAYVHTNPSYPQPDKVTLDLGNKFAGETIRLRFRIGSDGSAGAPGWQVDNIAFTGVLNTPFEGWVPDPGCTGEGPTTSAGSESGDADTSDATDTDSGGPGQGASDGCGCRSGPAPAGWQLVPWLALFALRRRRSGGDRLLSRR